MPHHNRYLAMSKGVDKLRFKHSDFLRGSNPNSSTPVLRLRLLVWSGVTAPPRAPQIGRNAAYDEVVDFEINNVLPSPPSPPGSERVLVAIILTMDPGLTDVTAIRITHP